MKRRQLFYRVIVGCIQVGWWGWLYDARAQARRLSRECGMASITEDGKPLERWMDGARHGWKEQIS